MLQGAYLTFVVVFIVLYRLLFQFFFRRQNNFHDIVESVPWVPEVFLARGGNFRCGPKADTSSAVGALEKSLAPRVLNPRRKHKKHIWV